jgi:predicted PhzF superfamily epimerase YddE/YHI9
VVSPRTFVQVDVFSERAGAGNPLAVVLDAEGLDDAAMQRIATWANLAETTFLLAPDAPGADYRVRIFTTRQEIAFAGHPSIGSAYAALWGARCRARDGRLVQQCKAGLLPITVEDDGTVEVRVPRSRIVRRAAAGGDGLLDAALGGAPRGAAPSAASSRANPPAAARRTKRERGTRTYTLPSCTTAQLVVNPAGLVALSTDYMQAA